MLSEIFHKGEAYDRWADDVRESALPRKRPSATAAQHVVMGHVWTAPAVQEESDVLRSVRVQPCIRPVFEWRTHLHFDAAAVAAGPDVIR